MILLNRLNGQVFALNPDLLERADPTPDTVITLVTGAKYVVAQSLDELAELVSNHRAALLERAQLGTDNPGPSRAARATVLRFPEGDEH
ncbi:hypothetical protein GCM10022243_41130 [Saccharothrix violaceirubra]|uniref:Flagellar protein FlbD n=1 Tax=Saccharothrix violaceirubra TaxID=413306 RepID=A0A7W7T881_9PSEU|nr:flagellar FlbD family protein [Saccharothrix violaceirubra]MBB4968369.1 flagellar protein FlbD [Saccharothrix violaceirubra]